MLYETNLINILIPLFLKCLSLKVDPSTNIKKLCILNKLLINIIRGILDISLRLLVIKEVF